jgi:hypothetical protein
LLGVNKSQRGFKEKVNIDKKWVLQKGWKEERERKHEIKKSKENMGREFYYNLPSPSHH